MTNLGSSSRATNPVPQNISLGRGGKGSSSQPWAPIFECPANHARVHSHKKLKKPNPLFTISLQSDGLEIKRKGEGGKITWEGRKKQSHVFHLILLFFFFFGLNWVFFCCFQPRVVTLTNDDAGRRFMGGLGALTHYHEQSRALRPPLWGAIGNFLGGDRWARGRARECWGAARDGLWDDAQGEDTEQGMRNGPWNPCWKGKRSPLLLGELSVEWFNGYL